MKKEEIKELKEEVEELKKSNNMMKNILKLIIAIIIILSVFGLGWFAGKKLADKENEIIDEKEEAIDEIDEEANVGKSIYTPDSEIASKTEDEKLKYYFTYQEPISKKEFDKTLEKGQGNDVIARNDIKEFFAYLNGQIEAYSDSVVLINIFDYADGEEGKDLIALKGIYLLECVYDMNFVDIPGLTGGYKIVSQNDYDKMKEYLSEVPTLRKYDDLFKEMYGDDFTSEEFYQEEPFKEMYDHDVKYLNKNYYVAYEYGDGYGSANYYFEVEDIIKKTKTEYDISYNVYQSYRDENENEVNFQIYEGILNVEVVNGHLKYYPSIIKAVK